MDADVEVLVAAFLRFLGTWAAVAEIARLRAAAARLRAAEHAVQNLDRTTRHGSGPWMASGPLPQVARRAWEPVLHPFARARTGTRVYGGDDSARRT